jgi:hypothetical protein
MLWLKCTVHTIKLFFSFSASRKVNVWMLIFWVRTLCSVRKLVFRVFLRLYNYCVILYCNGSSAWGLGEGLRTHHYKKTACYEMLHKTFELAGSYEHGNEPSGSIKGGEFLD